MKLLFYFFAVVTFTTEAHWMTIEPRSRFICFIESLGFMDDYYYACKQGYQQLIQFDSYGGMVVIDVRALSTSY